MRGKIILGAIGLIGVGFLIGRYSKEIKEITKNKELEEVNEKIEETNLEIINETSQQNKDNNRIDTLKDNLKELNKIKKDIKIKQLKKTIGIGIIVIIFGIVKYSFFD